MSLEVEHIVLKIIRETVSDQNKAESLEMDTPLLGGPVWMNEIDYVYIIARLRDAFGFCFDPEDFDQYTLNSASAFAACLKKHLER